MPPVFPVTDQPEAVKHFVEEGLWQGKRQLDARDGEYSAIGFVRPGGGLVAGFVYHNYDPSRNVIELSAYSAHRRWSNVSTLRTIFEYPFDQLGVRVVAGRHDERNTLVRRIWRALGAREVLIPELWAPGVAEAVAVLTRDTWRASPFCRTSHGDQKWEKNPHPPRHRRRVRLIRSKPPRHKQE